MDDLPIFEPFQAVTLVDCPSPEPPEATADAPPPEATADPPASVVDLVVYRPYSVDMHVMIGNLVAAAAWANARGQHDFESVQQTRPLPGFAEAWANILRNAGIVQETNFADEETRTLSVTCPILPPGGARVDRPARRE